VSKSRERLAGYEAAADRKAAELDMPVPINDAAHGDHTVSYSRSRAEEHVGAHLNVRGR
jgi:hypothetical protein